MSEIFKIMLVGDTSTGKTSFVTQLMHRIPEKLPKPSTQLSFFTLKISKPPTIIQVWDSPGHPKYHLQIVGSVAGFRAALIFIDITNEHTYQRAKIIAEQLSMYGNLDLHIVKIKEQVVHKDPFKRKVSEKMLEELADKVKGEIFEYTLNKGVEDILQSVIEWVHSSKEKKSQTKRKKVDSFFKKEVIDQKFQKEQEPFCQCRIF